METQTEPNQGMGQELLADAKGVGFTAVNRLHSEVDNRKDDAATQAKSISSAIDRAGEGLDSNAPAWLKSVFTQGAQQVQKFADALEQKDSRQLVNDVSDFARKSPVTFLAACAAAGFAASRIFQAGAKGSTPSQPEPVGMGAQSTETSQYGSSRQFGGQSPSQPIGQPTSQSSSQPVSPVNGQFA